MRTCAQHQMKRNGLRRRPEEISRLSPLGYQHFNFLGYSFRLDEPAAKGQLRPLRNPNGLELTVA
jgi:hypothetical protein